MGGRRAIFPHSHSFHAVLGVPEQCSRFSLQFSLSTNYIVYLFVMPKRARSPEEPNPPSEVFVDLLEFIRPAFWALTFFMFLANPFTQPGLIVSVLNGQGRLMVSPNSLIFH